MEWEINGIGMELEWNLSRRQAPRCHVIPFYFKRNPVKFSRISFVRDNVTLSAIAAGTAQSYGFRETGTPRGVPVDL